MHQITPGKTRRVIPQRAIQTNIRFSSGVSIALALFSFRLGKARALTVLNCSHSQHPLIRIGTVIAL
jgi:hypothetical protein